MAAVRFGLIGAGRWGKNYIKTLESLPSRCTLTHLSTSKPENAKLVNHPVEVVSDWRQLIKSSCDAVIISSPSSTHAEMLEACLDAAKPCIVEKPCFLEAASAKRLCGRIQSEKHAVLVEYTQLFNPAFQTLRQRLRESGEAIRLITSEGMNLGPFRGDEPALWDWCPHDLSMALDLLGKPPVNFEILAGPRDPKAVPEQVSLRVGFGGGLDLWIQAGYLSQQKRRCLSVYTDEQLYVVDDLATDKLTVSRFSYPKRHSQSQQPLERKPIALIGATPPLAAAVIYFLDALEGGDRRYLDMSLTKQITQILSACEEQLRQERPIAYADVP